METNKPRCANARQFAAWSMSPPPEGDAGFCEDCTPEYQRKMSKAGRCDYPEVLFYMDRDGMIAGTFEIKENRRAL